MTSPYPSHNKNDVYGRQLHSSGLLRSSSATTASTPVASSRTPVSQTTHSALLGSRSSEGFHNQSRANNNTSSKTQRNELTRTAPPKLSLTPAVLLPHQLPLQHQISAASAVGNITILSPNGPTSSFNFASSPSSNTNSPSPTSDELNYNEITELITVISTNPYPHTHTDRSSNLATQQQSLISKEMVALDLFIKRNATAYNFPSDSARKLFELIVSYRILNPEWEKSASHGHRLQIFRAFRIFTRDVWCRNQFVITDNSIWTFRSIVQYHIQEYLKSEPNYSVPLILELCSIIKRSPNSLSEKNEFGDRLIKEDFLLLLVKLMASKNAEVLQSTVDVMIALLKTTCATFVDGMSKIECIESLLQLVQHAYSPSSQNTTTQRSSNANRTSLDNSGIPQYTSFSYPRLAAEIIAELCSSPECREQLKTYAGNYVFLHLIKLRQDDDAILSVSLRYLVRMVEEDPKSSKEIRFLSGIPTLLQLFDVLINSSIDQLPNKTTESTAPSSVSSSTRSLYGHVTPHSQPSTPSERTSQRFFASPGPTIHNLSFSRHSVSIFSPLILLLTKLSLDDENAFQIRKHHGIYYLGHILLSDCANDRISELECHEVRLRAMRALRYLYSIGRNRKIILHVFSEYTFMDRFIEIEDFLENLAPYEKLLDVFDGLKWQDKARIRANLESLRTLEMNDKLRGDYRIIEELGKGSFGLVFQVQYLPTNRMYALKELSLQKIIDNDRSASLRGLTEDESLEHAFKLIRPEIEIFPNLRHTNIVRYINSFIEKRHLYIVMELVEGTSLADHIQSLKKKNRKMDEMKEVWPIFEQLLCALGYLHTEALVLHRDLTCSNVIIDQFGRVKVVDFGLACENRVGEVLRQRAGTMNFCSPERVEGHEYSYAADMWSLGCILYQMLSGEPAFLADFSSVEKIVAADYAPLTDASPLAVQVVDSLLTVDPDKRADVARLAMLLGPIILGHLQSAHRSVNLLESKLEFERHERIKLQQTLQLERQKRQPSSTLKYDRGKYPDVKSNDDSSTITTPFALTPSTSSRSSPTPTYRHPSENGNVHNPSEHLRITPNSSAPSQQLSDSTSPAFQTIADPEEQLLEQIHKLVYVYQLPPTIVSHPEAHVIRRYMRALFGSPMSHSRLRDEMIAVLRSSNDIIDPAFYLQPEILLVNPFYNETYLKHTELITHAEMNRFIEEVLEEVGYYTAQAPVLYPILQTDTSHLHIDPIDNQPSTTRGRIQQHRRSFTQFDSSPSSNGSSTSSSPNSAPSYAQSSSRFPYSQISSNVSSNSSTPTHASRSQHTTSAFPSTRTPQLHLQRPRETNNIHPMTVPNVMLNDTPLNRNPNPPRSSRTIFSRP